MSTHNICFYRGDSNEYRGYPQHTFFGEEAILMSTHNICFYRGDSSEYCRYPQHTFLWRNKQTHTFIITKYPS